MTTEGDNKPERPLPVAGEEPDAADRTVEEEEAVQVAEAAADEPPAVLDELEEVASKSEELSPVEVERVVESLLFASPLPLTLEAAREVTRLDAEVLRAALATLGERYREGASGIVLVEVGGAWQLRTAAPSADYVRRLLRVRPQRLTRAALETLALVAYRQPATRADVEEVRGVDCGAVLKALLERRLLRILGKKEELGRPLLYGTTREFLEFFGLNSLEQMPTLREFQELSEEHRSVVEKETGATPQEIEGIAAMASQALNQKLSEGSEEDEAALDYLEAAMEEAEARSKIVSQQIASESEESPEDSDEPARHSKPAPAPEA